MSDVQYANEDDLKAVYAIIKQHKDIFSFVRQDKIAKHISRGTCVFDSDVVITFTKYKVKRAALKNCTTSPIAGDIWIHQIANKYPGNGKAQSVVRRFLESCGTARVFLSVAKHNDRAIAFYRSLGFSFAGEATYNIGGSDVASHICVYSSTDKSVFVYN